MKLALVSVAVGALAMGCAGPSVWRASEDHGDKPGTGFEVTDRDGKLSATVFVLPPEHPDAFWLGRRLHTETTQTSASDIRLIVRIGWSEPRQMFLHFKEPMTGDKVEAELRFREDGTPRPLTFVSQPRRADNAPLRHDN